MECKDCFFYRDGKCRHYTSLRPCDRESEEGVYQFEYEGNYGLSVKGKDWANAMKKVADLYGATYTIRKEGQVAKYEKGKRVL